MPAPNSGLPPLRVLEEWRVDLLDMDAAVLDCVDALGELDQLARRGLRIEARTVIGQFQKSVPPAGELSVRYRAILNEWGHVTLDRPGFAGGSNS